MRRLPEKAALINLGCKVNAYEADAMGELLTKAGCRLVSEEEGPGIVIVNTCTVTNIADRKSRQMLHRARRLNPDAVIVAAGCYVETMEQPPEGVDILIGNNRKGEIVQILEDYVNRNNPGGCGSSALLYSSDLRCYEELNISRTTEHTRAFIKVQDGCNQFCSYCAIPLARGRVRSRDAKDVAAEVRRLAGNGYKEIVLTGIHLSSYGTEHGFGNGHAPDACKDYKAADSALLDLVRCVHEVEGIERIRLGSLEPRIVTDAFVDGLSALPKVCPHYHLALQSGCDETLRRMNRRYTTEEYEAACERIRKRWPLAALCTDIIVGFPGETDREFESSYRFVERMHFYETHVFKYSRRRGTRADAMPDQVPDSVKTERSGRLLELNKISRAAYISQFEGRELQVLIEDSCTGHSAEYLQCRLPEEPAAGLSGQIVVCRAVSGQNPGQTDDMHDTVSGGGYTFIPCKIL